MKARVIVVGNNMGDTGKSTIAMHLVVAMLDTGSRVAVVDLDARKGTLSRYLVNRRAYCRDNNIALPMPGGAWAAHDMGDAGLSPDTWAAHLQSAINQLASSHDVIVMDIPGADDYLSRLGHSYADTLITPLDESLSGLEVLARLNVSGTEVTGPGSYAEMVWEQKKIHALRDGGSSEWIALCNRTGRLDNDSRHRMEKLLSDISTRFGIRVVPGFSERTIYHELSDDGLTVMDSRRNGGKDTLTLPQVAARQELRNMLHAIGL